MCARRCLYLSTIYQSAVVHIFCRSSLMSQVKGWQIGCNFGKSVFFQYWVSYYANPLKQVHVMRYHKICAMRVLCRRMKKSILRVIQHSISNSASRSGRAAQRPAPRGEVEEKDSRFAKASGKPAGAPLHRRLII